MKDSGPRTSHGWGHEQAGRSGGGRAHRPPPLPAQPQGSRRRDRSRTSAGTRHPAPPGRRLQPRWPHTAVLQGLQAVGTAPVHTQSGPSALQAPGSRPALTPATAPKCWAQREQCSPRKARAGSAQEDGSNQGLRSPPAHPDASRLVQPGQGLSWMLNQQEGENRGRTGVSAAGTLPGEHIFLALRPNPKAGTRCPAERAASCLRPAPL